MKGLDNSMKKHYYILSSVVILLLALTACGGNDDTSSGSKGKAYKETESFELDYPVLNRDFALNETGDVLFWGEDNSSRNREQPSYVWVDGEIKDLGTDKFSSNAVLLPSGIIIKADKDRDLPKNEQHSIIEYDPATDSEEKFVAQGDIDEILLHVGPGRYLEDPKTYVHTVSNPNIEGKDAFIWDIENNIFKDLTIIQQLKDIVEDDELSGYPHFTLSQDASTVYASHSGLGLFAYDVASGELDELVSDDKYLTRTGNTTLLTSDEKHFAYGINDSSDAKLKITIHAVDVDTKETVEIGQGTKVFTLTDGNIIIVDDEEVKHYDFETKTLETIHTIELEENQKLDNVTVSTDGSTIAYGYTEKTEENETSNLNIIRNK